MNSNKYFVYWPSHTLKNALLGGICFMTLLSCADAQIFQCGSTWQNKPCGEETTTSVVFQENIRPTPTADEKLDGVITTMKQAFWKLEGNYPEHVLLNYRVAIDSCKIDKHSSRCKEGIEDVVNKTLPEIQRIDAERAEAYRRERASQAALALELAKLTEMQKQTALQEQQLREIQEQYNRPVEIRIRP